MWSWPGGALGTQGVKAVTGWTGEHLGGRVRRGAQVQGVLVLQSSIWAHCLERRLCGGGAWWGGTVRAARWRQGTVGAAPFPPPRMLRNNRISCIHNDSFTGLRNVRLLSLYDNQIATISPGAFDTLQALSTL